MGEIEEINLCYYLPAAATACLAHTHSLPKKTLKVTLVATSVLCYGQLRNKEERRIMKGREKDKEIQRKREIYIYI